MSFFEKIEIWKEEYMFIRYVFLNFNDYKNLNFNFPIGIILILSAIALPASIFLINHRKNVTTNCLKQLIRHNAIGEAGAKTLHALRLSNVKMLKRMLFSSSRFSSIVKVKGYTKPSYEDYLKEQKAKKKSEKPNLDSIEIYLAEEKLSEAESAVSIGTTPIWKPIIISASIIIILAAIFVCMPEMLEFINSRFSN